MASPGYKVRWQRDQPTLQMHWLVPGNWKDFPPSFIGRNTVEYLEGELVRSQGNKVSDLGKLDAVGGDFQVKRRRYVEFNSLGSGPMHYSVHGYQDPMADGNSHHYLTMRAEIPNVSNSSVGWEPLEPSSNAQLDALGATAISRMIPTSPGISLAAFVGELHEGLPKLGLESLQGRTARARAAGSDYLNAEFGWKSLLSDVRKMCATVSTGSKRLRDMYANSGKLLKRRYDFPEIVTRDNIYHEGALCANGGDPDLYDWGNHVGRRDYRFEKRISRWCEAAFIYYLPDPGNFVGAVTQADKLLGLRVTPDTLWQLAPWSWAIDWFSNVGDVVANYTALQSDSLVMPYAYMMERIRFVNEFQLSKVAFRSYPGYHTLRQEFHQDIKTRRKANPYGFGVDFGSLTNRQIAILAALGISKI